MERKKCIYLDDSFVHEVHHNGTKDRYIFNGRCMASELDSIEKRYNS